MEYRYYSAIILLVGSVLFSFGSTRDERPKPIFGNFTPEEGAQFQRQFGWSHEMEAWVPPKELKKELPYYVAGYDYEGRPVGVAEVGRWNLKKYMDKDEHSRELTRNYTKQGLYRLCTALSPIPNAEEGVVMIFDAMNFQASQLTSSEVVKSHLLLAKWAEACASKIAEFYIVNMNFAGSTWVELVRPVAGSIIGRSVIIGTDQQKVKAFLTSKIPRDELPPWYGGKSDYKPLVIW